MRYPLLLLILLAAPRWAAADLVANVSGTFLGPNQDGSIGLTYSSDRLDGSDEFFNDLPDLFDANRLAGGTLAATLRIPAGVAPGPSSGATIAFYNFAAGTVASNFTLFDVEGAAIYTGASGPGTSGLGIVQNNDNSLLDAVQLGTDSLDPGTMVTGLWLPQLLGGETDLYGGAAVRFSSNDLSILGGLDIPTDTAIYRRFPGGIFVASAAIDTFSPAGDQFAEVLSGVTYRITNVTVAAVPEPSSMGLLLVGGLAFLGVARRGTVCRRRALRSSPVRDSLGPPKEGRASP